MIKQKPLEQPDMACGAVEDGVCRHCLTLFLMHHTPGLQLGAWPRAQGLGRWRGAIKRVGCYCGTDGRPQPPPGCVQKSLRPVESLFFLWCVCLDGLSLHSVSLQYDSPQGTVLNCQVALCNRNFGGTQWCMNRLLLTVPLLCSNMTHVT